MELSNGRKNSFLGKTRNSVFGTTKTAKKSINRLTDDRLNIRIKNLINDITRISTKNGGILTINEPSNIIIQQNTTNNTTDKKLYYSNNFNQIEGSNGYLIKHPYSTNKYQTYIIYSNDHKLIGYYIKTLGSNTNSQSNIIYYICKIYKIKLESVQDKKYFKDVSQNNIGYFVSDETKTDKKFRLFRKDLDVYKYDKFNVARKENNVEYGKFIGKIKLSESIIDSISKNMTKNNIINATIYKNSINTSKLDNTVITKKEEELKNLEKEITELTNKIETNTAAFKNANTTSAQTLKLAQVKNNSLEYKIENGNLESEKNTKNKRKINATQRYLNAKKNYMANINKNMEKINEMQDELNKKNKAKIALDKELSDIKEKKNKLNTYTQKQTNLNINNMSQQTKYIKANLLDYLDSIYKNVETVYSDLKTKQADPNVIKKTGEILNNIYKTKKDPSKLFKNTSKNITSQVTTPSQTSQTSLMSPQLV
jgi:hypothetical protein